MASVLKGCNIGGGELIPKIFLGWMAFFQQQQREGGVGGEEVEELLFLSKRLKVSNWSLCLVGCFSPSVVTSPYLWPEAKDFELLARK